MDVKNFLMQGACALGLTFAIAAIGTGTDSQTGNIPSVSHTNPDYQGDPSITEKEARDKIEQDKQRRSKVSFNCETGEISVRESVKDENGNVIGTRVHTTKLPGGRKPPGCMRADEILDAQGIRSDDTIRPYQFTCHAPEAGRENDLYAIFGRNVFDQSVPLPRSEAEMRGFLSKLNPNNKRLTPHDRERLEKQKAEMELALKDMDAIKNGQAKALPCPR